jgi:hypothetical protein
MRHIIIVLFLLPFVAFGQYPINVRNIQTGYQTSGEGLFFRGNGYPNYKPPSGVLRRHGTFMHVDTVGVRIWAYMQDTTNADSGWVKIFPIDVPPAVLNGEVVGPIANNKLGIVDRVRFDITYTPPFDTLGVMWFDANSETVNAIINGGTRYQLGEELFYPIIINKSGSAILKGQLVMVDPVTPISGDHIRVVPAVNNGTYPSTTIMGVAASQIENDATGLITWFGYVSELKQSEIAQTGITLDIGDILYPSTTQPGKYTDIAPSSPSHKSSIALVVRKPNGNNNNITILVRPWLAPKLDDLSDVDVTGRTINSGLLWNGVKWKATTKSIPTIATGNEDYLVKFTGTDVPTGEITIGNSVVKESTGSIGIDITPTEKLDVNGTLRVRNTNKPVTTTKLLGVNDNGVVQEVSVSSGLTNNSLVITGNTDLSFTGSTSPVTLNSSTGTDVTITAGSNVTLSQTGNNLTISSTNSGGTVTGTGDVNKIPKWTTTTALGNSVIEESAAGDIGIGKTPDAGFKLDVNGTTRSTQFTIKTSSQSTTMNNFAPTGSPGFNLWIGGGGQSSVWSTPTSNEGSYNVSLGSGALLANTFGSFNLGMGADALKANTTGTNNVAIGANALLANDIASNNLAIGASALRNYAIVTTGGGTGNNTAIGGSALTSLVKDVATSVAGNTAIGASAMIFTKNSDANTAIGVNAMRHSEGQSNVAIGNASLFGTDPNPTGTPRYRTGVLDNVAIGSGTIQTFGTASTLGNINISSNVAIGRNAANTVSNNRALTRGIYIGAYTGVSAGTTDVTNEIVIGSGTSGVSNLGNGSNTTTIGNSSTTATYIPAGNMRIGSTVAPTERLDVTGTARATRLAVNTSGQIMSINNYYPSGSSGNNVFLGNGGQSQTSASNQNIGIGVGSLFAVTSGYYNTAIGALSLTAANSGHSNTGIGSQSLLSLTSGSKNFGIGTGALQNITTQEDNLAIGHVAGQALNNTSDGTANTFIGTAAAQYLTSGSYNLIMGWEASKEVVTASALATSVKTSILLGARASAKSNGDENEIVIGVNGQGNGSNTTTIGNGSTTATIIPAGKLGVGIIPKSSFQIYDPTTNPVIWLSGGTVTHPFTSLPLNPVVESNVTAIFAQRSSVTGGAQFNGLSANGNAGTAAIDFQGYLGSESPDNDAVSLLLRAWKLDATTGGRTPMTGSNKVLRVATGNTSLIEVQGDGKVGIGTTTPSALLHVNGSFRVSDAALAAAPNFNATRIAAVDNDGDLRSIAIGSGLALDPTTQTLSATGGAAGTVTVSGSPASGQVAVWASASAIGGQTSLNVNQGGTGATTQQAAINALSGSVTSGQYLRGNGTNVVMSALSAGDLTGTIPTGVLGNSTLNVGTTSIALNRASGSQSLTGISSLVMPNAAGNTTITPAATSGSITITLPATTGTVITNADNGTVTGTMIANGTVSLGAASATPSGDVTGILPPANGGTGLSSATGYIKGTGAAYTVVNTIPVSEGGTGLGAVNSNGLVLFNNNTTSTDAYTRQTPSLYTASTANPIVWDVNYRSSGIYRITNNSTTNISNVTVSNFVTGGIYAFHIQNASNTIQITVTWPTNFKDLTASTNYGTRVYTTPSIITCYHDGSQFVCE